MYMKEAMKNTQWR